MVEFVVKTDEGILRNPKNRPPICYAIYVVDNGFIKTSIIKTGKPRWFIRHFVSSDLSGHIKKNFDEYHIMVDREYKIYNSNTGEVQDVFRD